MTPKDLDALLEGAIQYMGHKQPIRSKTVWEEEAVALRLRGWKQKQLAERFGVSKQRVQQILKRNGLNTVKGKRRANSLEGCVFGRLTVISRSDEGKYGSHTGQLKWLCKCQCGRLKYLYERQIKVNPSCRCDTVAKWVEEARRLHNLGWDTIELAKKFGVSRVRIYQVL